MPGRALPGASEAPSPAVATLQAALEALDDPEVLSRYQEAPSKRDVVAAAERVKTDAAKIGLMCGPGEAPSPAVSESLSAALLQSVLALCARCCALSGAGAGPTLRGDVRKLAGGVVEPCSELLSAMGSGEDLKRRVGLVWQGCDAVAKAGLENRGALFKGLAKVMAVLKDTLREMAELEEGTASSSEGDDDGDDDGGADGARQGGGDGANGDGTAAAAAAAAAGGSTAGARVVGCGCEAVVDLDFDPGRLDAAEQRLLSACRALMEAATGIVRALGRALLQGPPLAAGEGGGPLDGWESALFHAQNAQRSVEDLGAAMYPPQDVSDAAEAAGALAVTCDLLLDECPDPDALGSELAALAEALRAAHARVEEAAEAAGAEGQGEGGVEGAA
ncbi:hypothetical protein Rsub_11759 [Raphidocelis subcapitata]|uniref:Cyclin-D1-binding protein 1-like N-terminal domain-containing protein n=1 Tax=Raphidocelis subcapitata TaxID=307507 RepID=A0A2V0PPF5_9CHLO|nr:hypothetical protein Rsub_11759 [Raphidocelis subcapitata]|eukprot:GBF99347.1 hypothetical protein Rsub_11759 [Raphidocelis subcapitata]